MAKNGSMFMINKHNILIPVPKQNRTREPQLKKNSSIALRKMQGTIRSGEGGERRACYVTPDLSYDWEGERKRRAEIIPTCEPGWAKMMWPIFVYCCCNLAFGLVVFFPLKKQ